MGTSGDLASRPKAQQWLRPGHLLFALLLMFVLVPTLQSVVAGGDTVGHPGSSLVNEAIKYGFVTVLMVAAVSVAQAPRPWTVIALLAGVPALLGLPATLSQFDIHSVPRETLRALSAASEVYTAVALMYVVWRGLARLFQRGRVTGDTISVAICAYILLGFAWMWLYSAVETIAPDAFGRSTTSTSELFYFSFVTLTTLGYGDITPHLPVVRSLAILEAIIGQMYVAVVMARLVSMYMHDDEDRRETDASRPDPTVDQG